MTDSPQPNVQEFLFDFVENVEDLLILGWFQRLGMFATGAPSDIARVSGTPELTLNEGFERLAKKGLLEKKAGETVLFRYSPPTPEFSAVLDVVLERYDRNSMDILRIMSANSIERLRRAALRTLVESQRGEGPKRG